MKSIYKYIFIVSAIFLLAVHGYAQQPTAKTFLEIGVKNLENAEYSEAIDSLTHAVKLKPDFAEAHYNLGNAYFGLHRYDEAHKAYKNAVKADPEYADAYFSLGVISSMLGMDKEAVGALKNAVKYDPGHMKALIALGDLYSELENYEQATDAFRRAVKAQPKSAQARYKLGVAYIELSKQNMESARKEYNLLKKLDQDYARELRNRLTVKK